MNGCGQSLTKGTSNGSCRLCVFEQEIEMELQDPVVELFESENCPQKYVNQAQLSSLSNINARGVDMNGTMHESVDMDICDSFILSSSNDSEQESLSVRDLPLDGCIIQACTGNSWLDWDMSSIDGLVATVQDSEVSDILNEELVYSFSGFSGGNLQVPALLCENRNALGNNQGVTHGMVTRARGAAQDLPNVQPFTIERRRKAKARSTSLNG